MTNSVDEIRRERHRQKTKGSRRALRWLIGIGVCVALYTVLGFWVLPRIVRSQAEKRLSAELGRAVNIGKVQLNPYALSLVVENFDIREKTAPESFLGWKRLYVNFDALASLGGEWVVSDVALDGFYSSVAINPDRSFNFADLLEKFAPKSDQKSDSPPPPIRLGHLAVSSARVNFSDHSRSQPFTSVVGPLTFTLTDFRTAGAEGAPYHFRAETEAGEKFSWRGTLAAQPLGSKGEFEIANLVLKKYTPYLPDQVRADLSDGKLSLSGRYEASFAPGQHVLRLADGKVQLRDLRVSERGVIDPLLTLPSVDVTGLQADGVAMAATAARVAVTGGEVNVSRGKDGAVNLLSLLAPATNAPPQPSGPAVTVPLPTAAPSAVTAKLPQVTVGEFALTGFAINATDHAASTPVTMALGGMQFTVQNFSLAPDASIPLDLAFTLAPQGTVRVAGTVTLFPEMKGNLKTEVAGVDLAPFSPYLEQFVNARLTSGVVATTNAVSFSLPGGQPAVEFSGDVQVEKFALVDTANNQELAGVSRLAVMGIKAATAPELEVAVAEINLTAPYARVAMNADQTLNVLTLVKGSAPAAEPKVVSVPITRGAEGPAPEKPAVAAAPLPKVAIGRLVVTDGDFSFTDRSIEPNVRTSLKPFNGSVAGLSSRDGARADVDLKGMVDGAGPVAITGKVDPLGSSLFVDLKVDCRNIDLQPLSPYAGKYAGYELARGKLVVDTKVLLDGKKIDAKNVVTLNQLTFGGATNNPAATTLPVRLGVALLKDAEGKIVLDVPIQGNLDDPSFEIGKVVTRVLVNMLTKVATSPFSLIGSMFGGAGEELAFQEFAPGSVALQPDGIPKLQTMVKALANRPALALGLEGGFDAASDTHELKRKKFADLVRSQSVAKGGPADSNQTTVPREITPEEHAATVKKLFDEKFPPGTQFGAPLPPPPPPPVVAAKPPPARASIIRRIVATITRADRAPVPRIVMEEVKAPPSPPPGAEVPKPTEVTEAGLPLEEMAGRLTEAIEVTEEDLRALAVARAESVREYFLTTGNVAPDRLFLTKNPDAAKAVKGPRVVLTLQ